MSSWDTCADCGGRQAGAEGAAWDLKRVLHNYINNMYCMAFTC